MDSGFWKVEEGNEGRHSSLSTPCNGFLGLHMRLSDLRIMLFQLHVMDSLGINPKPMKPEDYVPFNSM